MELSSFFQKEHHDKYSKVFPFPPDDIDPKVKATDYEWHLKHAEGIWSEYNRNNCYVQWTYGTNQYDYTTLRLYAEGNQPIEKYKNQIAHADPEKNDRKRVMYEGISWDNQSVLPRFKESVMMLLDEMDVFYAPKAVDEASISLKSRIKHLIWERTQNKFYPEFYAKMGMEYKPDVPFHPTNMTELDIFAQSALELSHEIKMKKVIDAVMEESEWTDELKLKFYEDMFTLGIAIGRSYMDPHTGKEVVEYVDPQYAIFPKSELHNYKDIKRFGHVKWMSVIDMRKAYQKAGQYRTEKEFFKKIESMIDTQMFPNDTADRFSSTDFWSKDQVDSHGSFPYDYLKIPVLCYEWATWNTDVVTEKANGKIYFEKHGTSEKNTETAKTSKKSYESWHRCEWVIGTDMLLSFGPRYYVTRDVEGKTICSYFAYRVSNKSMVASMIPIEDQIEIITKKYQVAWKRAAPSGFRTNWGKLQGMSLKNGAKLHPFEVLDIYMDTGILFENDTKEMVAGSRMASQAQSFTPITGGLGNILNEYITAFGHEMQKLSTITGVTETLLGASPTPNQLIGTTQLSIQGSMNRLKPLFKGYKMMKKEATKRVMIDILNYARFNPQGFKATYKSFSDNTLEKILIGAEDSKYRFSLVIEQIATDEMRQVIIQSAQQAVAKGVMSEVDLITIVEHVQKGNVKFAKMLLEYKQAKTMQMQSQMAEQNAQMNAQMQQQSTQIATDGKLQEIAKKGEEERKTKTLESQLESRNPQPVR